MGLGLLRWTAGLALVSVLVSGPVVATVGLAQGAERPNIVVILTDDQHVATLRWMPAVQRAIAARGITFTRATVANPRCCPSRASILTGLYSHATGVYSNAGTTGGAQGFIDHGNEARAIGPALRAAGYRTGLVGKYLNSFRRSVAADYVPPGWSTFVTFHENNGHYYGYDLAVDGVVEHRGSAPEDYSTDVLREHALRFVADGGARPFFLLFAPYAPHGPATPAPRHAGSLAGMPPHESLALNEADVSDKPAYIRRRRSLSPRALDALQRRIRRRTESLLAVDEAVQALVAALRQRGELGHTMIVFLSDNALSYGEHRWTRKLVPYEASVRVPFVIRYDPLTAPRSGSVTRKLVSNIDLFPTFLELASVDAPPVDGRSLLPILRGDEVGWRDALLIEHLSTVGSARGSVPTYCAIRTSRWKYVRYGTGFRELYDLRRDPHELTNVARDRRGVRRRLHARLRSLCDPPPPGYSI